MLDRLVAIWTAVYGVLTIELFSIGGTSVTSIGVARVIVVVCVAALVSRLVRTTLARVSERWPGTDRAALYTVGRVAHYIFLGIGVSLGLSTIGVDFTNLAVVLGALGIGIGFGLQDIVANFIAGLVILFERHLRVGDFIELESGVSGEVKEIRIRATRVATNDNIDILVPNLEFVRGRVVNWTLDEGDRRIRVPFGVAYGTDKEVVRAAALEAADRTPHTLRGRPERRPQVWLVSLGDSSLDFELVVWLTPVAGKRPSLVHADYLWEIHSALVEHGIEIPFPQKDIHVRSLLGLDQEAALALLRSRGAAPSSEAKSAASSGVPSDPSRS
jgi:small-conductance mechanosensitive channel